MTIVGWNECVTIDKCQYAMHMRVGFKTYNLLRLIYKCLNEVIYPFTHRSEAFAGKPSEEGGEYYLKSTEDLTLRLIEKTGENQNLRVRNLTTDNLYTSIPLANKLLERSMTLLGTMRQNRVGLPKEVKSLENRVENSTEVWWEKDKQKITLNSYVVKTKSKGKNNIIILATMSPLLGVTKDDGKKKGIFFDNS